MSYAVTIGAALLIAGAIFLGGPRYQVTSTPQGVFRLDVATGAVMLCAVPMDRIGDNINGRAVAAICQP